MTELPLLQAYPDSVFMQDPALLGSGSSIIGRSAEEARRGEETELVRDLAMRGMEINSLGFVKESGILEGGDIMVTENELFVGESKRSNASGIEQLSQMVRGRRVTPVKTDLMHLLCGCSYLNKSTMIIAPELISLETFRSFKVIKIPTDEAYATDALYLGEGNVLIPLGFPKTVRKLRDAGYKPVEIDISEFWKGDGGVTCLSSPVYKNL